MNKANKKRRNHIKKLIKEPPQELSAEVAKYKKCSCRYVGPVATCPKCGSKMKKIGKKDWYFHCKSMLKVLVAKEMVTADELHTLQLIKLCRSGR